jgi:hypothetical protein
MTDSVAFVSSSRPDYDAINLGKDDPWPDPTMLRPGTQVTGWVMLRVVSLGFELWRQFNGFPPMFDRNPIERKKKPKDDKDKVKAKGKSAKTTTGTKMTSKLWFGAVAWLGIWLGGGCASAAWAQAPLPGIVVSPTEDERRLAAAVAHAGPDPQSGRRTGAPTPGPGGAPPLLLERVFQIIENQHPKLPWLRHRTPCRHGEAH